MSPARWLGLVVLLAIACIATWKVDAWRYGKQLADVRKEFADYKSNIATAATKASEDARALEQQRQRDIEKVRTDAAEQKQKDDALADLQRADGDRLRNQIGQLLADKRVLNTRLAERGKTIEDLVDLLAELRSEADGYAGELAAALTASRRAGFACEASYDAVSRVDR
jgi:chromosome segregation ATPase